jgi:hypothetical protein
VLKFIQCKFETPPSATMPIVHASRLFGIQFDHCQGLSQFSTYWAPVQRRYTEFMSAKISYLPETAPNISQALSHLSLSISRGLTIEIDSGVFLDIPAVACH